LKAAFGIAEVNNRVLQCLRGVHVVIMRLFALCVKYIITLTCHRQCSPGLSSRLDFFWCMTENPVARFLRGVCARTNGEG
jgi:hypothetical protein